MRSFTKTMRAMRHRGWLAGLALSLALLGAVPAARAGTITWILSNVSIYGTSVTGSFTVDSSTGALVSQDLALHVSTPPATFTHIDFADYYTFAVSNTVQYMELAVDPGLYPLGFADTTHATLDVWNDTNTLFGGPGCCAYGADPGSLFVRASTAVPEPASLALLGTAIGMAGAFHRRQPRA
ncbi:PEP-CTERM sorting domain-containing protein [Paracraurococcus lichenis]|uniref:PEP-CTERM sorting domain-containing protein n=1 Tax=Paracraurococcus lichenis TaxID=3064888 RepID=A0ABT9DW44_9PROT|nr:PEP-CTERM sorting domain-containing protein [Paracraurococcus sp. LOR1-02]MDO9708126.1 PEP-CTERM sorting domain-containing protein [Paracraurococcus sp. LOR1-02]